MMSYNNILFLYVLVLILEIKCSDMNSTFLISKYAKVSHWGHTTTSTENIPLSEGRSNNGQSLWMQRSDVNIISGQNLRNRKNNVIYHYALSKKQSSKFAQDKREKLPAVGEVQERFNPKPYFDYSPVLPKGKVTSNNVRKPVTLDSSYKPSPVFNKPPIVDSLPTDSYDSPFNSYNPQVGNADDSSDGDPAYPPIAPPNQNDDDDQQDDSQLPESNQAGYSYINPTDGNHNFPVHKEPMIPPNGQAKPYASFGPPLAPPEDHMEENHGPDQNVFYPSNDSNGAHGEVILDHPPPGYAEDHQGHSDSNDNGNMGGKPDMDNADLNPPPPNGNGNFPHYLYNGAASHGLDNSHYSHYDFDHHHVYEEVEPPTTPAPEDKRVNKGHYSYYYLGRKLWYIPLYFSVYFIIYVTVLILKSIARHKIQLKHDFHDKFREGREMGANENIDEKQRNITSYIYNAKEKYMM